MEDITIKLEKLGFAFNQPEHCTKGKMTVVLDCYPFLFETGENKGYWFETYEEFYKEYIKVK